MFLVLTLLALNILWTPYVYGKKQSLQYFKIILQQHVSYTTICHLTSVGRCPIALNLFCAYASSFCCRPLIMGQKQKKGKLMEHNQERRFATVLMDPPWSHLQGRGTWGAGNHYPLMSFDEISRMPIADLTSPNAHLYLWTTNGCLPYAFEIMKKWGFEYRSIFTWIKPKLGLGNYFRNCTEQVLFGTRGKAPVLFKAQPTWGCFPVQDHSHKPEEFHKIIERMSPGPYLELFARRHFPGWSVWGDSVPSDIRIPGYPVPKYTKEAA